MATWTVSAVDELCRGCDGVIPPNQPIALVTSVRLIRCVTCAGRMGLAVDLDAVDAARHRLEAERAAGEAIPVSAYRPVVHREPRRRGLTAARDLANLFDPKSAAAHDRD